MPWHWFAVCAAPPSDAFAVAEARTPDGQGAGFVAAWDGRQPRPPGALGIDPRAVDSAGPPGWLALALAPPGVRVLFDDPAVCHALREVLAQPWPRAVSTLTLDDSAIGGAITSWWTRPAPERQTPRNNPFARLFAVRLLEVGAGLLGELPPPVGPGIQRYAGSPWPWDRFP
jgi:hypothetical protein